MKKAVPMLVVIAAIATPLVVYFKRSKGTLDLDPGFAAELAPAETVLFVEFPDIARTAGRWNETSLHKIAEEPEWKAFTAGWDDFVAQNDIAKDVFGVFGEVQKADPAGLFIALTNFDNVGPKLVGGFPYRGRKGDVENVVNKLRQQIVKAYPAAKSEVADYEGTTVETLKDPKFTAAMAYQDNWFFFATDTDLLLKTLSRYGKKPNAPAALARDPVWMRAADSGSKDPDMRLWARWSFFQEKLAALGAMSGQPMPTVNDPNPIHSITYTWKLDGALMRDRMFFHTKDPVKTPPYPGHLLAFTNPATYAYMGVSFAGLEDYTKAMIQSLATLGLVNEANAALAPKGVKLEDVFRTFGPELALMSAWEAGGITLPDFFAAVEVKDKGKARAFAEFIADEMKGAGEVTSSTQGETTIWTVDSQVPFLKPCLAINAQHMMFGLNPNALNAGIKQLAEKGPNLVTHPGSPYPAALKTVVQPSSALIYLDAKTLFERLYDKVKPMIAFSLVGNPEAGKHFDAAKLPQAETISRHLLPMIVSYGGDPNGWVVESTGSVSVISMYMVALPTAFLGVKATAVPPPPIPGSAAPAPTQTFTTKGASDPKANQAETDVATLSLQLQTYQTLNGQYPTTQQGVKALVEKPTIEPLPKNWQKMMPEVPSDPWGQPYQYAVPGTRSKGAFDLFSAGPDKAPNTPDDIGNW